MIIPCRNNYLKICIILKLHRPTMSRSTDFLSNIIVKYNIKFAYILNEGEIRQFYDLRRFNSVER